MEFTPIGPRTTAPDAAPRDAAASAFLATLRDVSAAYSDRRIGQALGELQDRRPPDIQGWSLQKTAQSIGGGALRLAASPHADPVQVSGLSRQVEALAEVDHNLPRIEQIGREIKANLAAMRAAGGLEPGAEPALRRAEDDAAQLETVAGLSMSPLPPKEANALTAQVGRTVALLNEPPWRGGMPRDEVSSLLLGIAGTTYSMAATAGGSWAPAPVRRSLMELSAELRRVVDGDVRTTEASGRLSRRLDAVVEGTITRTGGLLGMDQNVRSLRADLTALPGAVERRLEQLRAGVRPDAPGGHEGV